MMREKELTLLDEKGIETVLREIALGRHGRLNSPERADVDAWVQSQIASKRDAREAETLSIAKEANRIARDEAEAAARSARWAKIAAIIAALAAFASIIIMIINLFSDMTYKPLYHSPADTLPPAAEGRR